MKIYVGNLSFNTDQASLTQAFEPHGEVTDVAVITDRDTGRSRGFGFVEMRDDNDARTAITALDGTELDGRQIKVNEAKPRTDRNDRGGGGGGYGGGGGNRDRGGSRNRW